MADPSTNSIWDKGGDGWSTAANIGQNIGNIFSSAAQYSYDRSNASASNKYNAANYKFNWQESKRDYRFRREGVDIARKNDVNERAWRDETANLDWQHGMAIRDYEYQNQMRAYNKSEQTYRQQLNFNNMAAQVAMESEDRWLDERFKETAFQNQDLFVQMLQEEGAAAASGQAGRSAGKTIQSVLAQAGRNQAILAESLFSAQKQYSVNLKKIGADKYGADIQADANRMLRPEIAPALPKPIPLPATIFQDPRKPRKPPKPPTVHAPSQTGSIIGSVASIGLGIASIFSDRRLKENITEVGKSESGIKIYEFNYIDESQRYQGVMAQDLLDSHPEAVVMDSSGYYLVNYDLIDVNMKPVN